MLDIKKYNSLIWSIVYKYGGFISNKDSRMDTYQYVAEEAVKGLERYYDARRSSVSTFLFIYLKHRLFNLARKEKKFQRRLRMSIKLRCCEGDYCTTINEESVDIKRKLDKLGNKTKMVFELYFVNKENKRTVAQKMCLSIARIDKMIDHIELILRGQ